MNYLIYKLIRDDGQIYIGTTNSKCYKNRMVAHKNSERFINHSFSIEILEQSENIEVHNKEEEYIKLYNSFYNGLNESIDGKGNHNAPNFNTIGYKFSEESKRKMSESAKRRIERDGVNFKGKTHSVESKQKMSELRKGKCWHKPKLTKEQVLEIRELYNKNLPIEGVGAIQKNGIPLSYIQAFCKKYSIVYNVTIPAIKGIITFKTWKEGTEYVSHK